MSNAENQRILCDGCGEILPSSTHNKDCKVNIKFECLECNKKFKTYKYLQQHKIIHDKTYFQCQFCDKKLKTKRNLERHFLFLHSTPEKYHVCEICDDKFLRLSDLIRHSKIHSEKLFNCNKCKRQFHFNYNFTRHIKSCFKC